nr:uncharacterized protein LOC109409450 isoform X2 [Aedes albopictus]
MGDHQQQLGGNEARPDDCSFPIPDAEVKEKLLQFCHHVSIAMDHQSDNTASVVRMLEDLSIDRKFHHAVIEQLMKENVEKDETSRQVASRVVTRMFEEEAISKGEYVHALEKLFQTLADDIPSELFRNTATFYVRLLNRQYINLFAIRCAARGILLQHGLSILTELLHQYEAAYDRDAAVVLWQDSHLIWTDFFQTGDVENAEKVLTDAGLDYVLAEKPLNKCVDLIFEQVCLHLGGGYSNTYAQMCMVNPWMADCPGSPKCVS